MRAAGAGILAALLAAGIGPAHAACATQMATTATASSATDVPAAGVSALANSRIAIGVPTALRLLPIASVHFAVRPARTDGPYGGMFAFDAAQAGALRIALGGRAWIDVVDGRATIASVAHRHGAACSGIAKEVTFPLAAGPHEIEVTASEAPMIAIQITPTD